MRHRGSAFLYRVPLGDWGGGAGLETGFLCVALAVLELTPQTRLASLEVRHMTASASQVLGCKGTGRHAEIENLFLNLNSVRFARTVVHTPYGACSACGVQERAVDPLELELQVVWSNTPTPMWILGIEPRSSVRTSALNH